MDGILSAYVVKKFSVAIGITVIMGLIAAGLSTLEGIVQSLSTTITNDIIAPFRGLDENSKKLPVINKLVIVVIAIIAIVISYQQLLYPNLSVGILAQNGVYAFFSAAFVPVCLFGIFVKDMPKQAAIGAAMTAMIVHFSVYYGQLTPYTTGSIRNPAVAATIAILSAVFVGIALWVILRKKMNTQTEP